MVNSLIDQGILPGPPECPKCKVPMHLIDANGKYSDGCCWICNRVNKKNKRRCRIERNVRVNSIFEGSKLTLPELVFILCFITHYFKIDLKLKSTLFIFSFLSSTAGLKPRLSHKLQVNWILVQTDLFADGPRFFGKSVCIMFMPTAIRLAAKVVLLKLMNRSLEKVS